MRIIAEEDIALVHDDNQRRNNWRLGRVDSLIPGNDGEIWGAKVTETTPLTLKLNTLLFCILYRTCYANSLKNLFKL